MRSFDFVLALPLVAALPRLPSSHGLIKGQEPTPGTRTWTLPGKKTEGDKAAGLTDVIQEISGVEAGPQTVAPSTVVSTPQPVDSEPIIFNLHVPSEDDISSSNSIDNGVSGDQTGGIQQTPKYTQSRQRGKDGSRGPSGSTNRIGDGNHDQKFSSADDTPEEFKKTLAKLNKYRGYHNNTQGHVGKVAVVAWNINLATSAQEWADQCNSTGHSTPDGVGQNIYSTTEDLNLDDMGLAGMAYWYAEQSEYAKTKYRPIAFNMVWGHYSTLVWAVTRYLGCAKSPWCKDAVGGEPGYILVCNFWIAGNVEGEFEANVFVPSDSSSDSSSLPPQQSTGRKGLSVPSSRLSSKQPTGGQGVPF